MDSRFEWFTVPVLCLIAIYWIRYLLIWQDPVIICRMSRSQCLAAFSSQSLSISNLDPVLVTGRIKGRIKNLTVYLRLLPSSSQCQHNGQIHYTHKQCDKMFDHIASHTRPTNGQTNKRRSLFGTGWSHTDEIYLYHTSRPLIPSLVYCFRPLLNLITIWSNNEAISLYT